MTWPWAFYNKVASSRQCQIHVISENNSNIQHSETRKTHSFLCHKPEISDPRSIFCFIGRFVKIWTWSHDQGTNRAGKRCAEMCDLCMYPLMFLTGHGIKARTHAHAEITHFPNGVYHQGLGITRPAWAWVLAIVWPNILVKMMHEPCISLLILICRMVNN